MKLFVLIVMIITSFRISAQGVSVNMVPDTIDYENTRMYIEVPEISRKLSQILTDDEGFWIFFPIPGDSIKRGMLSVDYSVMNRNYLIETKDYDVEHWNTFNRNYVGYRCFMKNWLFYRIDRYEDGLEVFYTDVEENMVDVVNQAMKSICKKPRNVSDPPLSIKRKCSRNV